MFWFQVPGGSHFKVHTGTPEHSIFFVVSWTNIRSNVSEEACTWSFWPGWIGTSPQASEFISKTSISLSVSLSSKISCSCYSPGSRSFLFLFSSFAAGWGESITWFRWHLRKLDKTVAWSQMGENDGYCSGFLLGRRWSMPGLSLIHWNYR